MRVKNSTMQPGDPGASPEKPIEPASRPVKRRAEKRFGLKPGYAAIAREMCELAGTTANLAKAFGVDFETIALWQSISKEFAEACQMGLDAAERRVERGLFERAVGYTHIVETVVKEKSGFSIVKLKVPVPPDPRAAKTWREWQQADAGRTGESPLAQLYRQLEGTGLRPKENG
jgi:hypothetical protein